MTYEEILERMLDSVPGDLDKREGSIIYNALAPAAAELAQAYIKLLSVEDSTYADTSVGEDLKRRAAERGVIQEDASKAIRKGMFNIDVPIGSRFKGDDLNYVVIEIITTGEFKMECETEGEVGNFYSGSLIPIEYIAGLETAVLTDIIIPGENIEDSESLRKRYFETLESESFGGNIADYKKKTNSLQGVGGTKVYPVWNGGGTVKLVIIDSGYAKPSTVLINAVQTSIDPVLNNGKGIGIAAIGHVATVAGVDEMLVNIASNITLQNGYVWADVLPNIRAVIDIYIHDLNRTWADNTNLVIRVSQIETRILNVVGVLDIQSTLINNLAENLLLGADEIAILGTVTDI